ncbi:MAG: hypothetical protein GOMPHAMPRED_002922 [Gomphillus americanus]|uniref:Uncharacterized protein n=1 Tax=Gomphillus americanus TaxID=1940652 RepID=A0A8H3ECS2_9LECA|nr:MAG: hypothetical protein GOMPHAMPRED_002922 [Gomphillus americanus]
MSDLVNKVKDKVLNHESQKAQPGNSVENGADQEVNADVNQFADDVGVPQQGDGIIDEAVDIKTNEDIPFGNN